MKRWLQWGCTALLASSAAGLSTLWHQAFALTQPEILQKLQTVPVFILADNAGNMVPLSIFDGEVQDSQSFLGIFISQSDAQATLESLQEETDEANQLSTIPLPLADAYNMIINSQELEDFPPFAFIPQEEQLALAAQILGEQGEDVALTPLTVPLFHLSSTEDNSYITISRGESDRESIPLFFDGTEAQFLLNVLNEQASANNEPPPTIELRVAFLHQWLQILETNNEDALQLVELVPIPESQALIASLIEQLRQQQLQAPQTTPEASPPSAPPEAQAEPLPEAAPDDAPGPDEATSPDDAVEPNASSPVEPPLDEESSPEAPETIPETTPTEPALESEDAPAPEAPDASESEE